MDQVNGKGYKGPKGSMNRARKGKEKIERKKARREQDKT